MNKGYLMCVGCGVMQEPVIIEARRMGYKVIGVDLNANATGVKRCDIFEKISTKDYKAALRAARKYKKNLKGVFTSGTDVSMTVYYITEKLKLPGTSFKSAVNATKKNIMRKCFKKHGLNVPDFADCSDLKTALEISEKIKYPVVIKPVDSMGARGVKCIFNADELKNWFDTAMSYSIDKKVIIEKYIEGPEVSIDMIVYKNKKYTLTIADRIIEKFPYFVETGHNVPSLLNKPVLKRALIEMKKGIDALGITYGPAKCDMKISKDGIPYIGELPARISGGFHSQYTAPLATGLNCNKIIVKLAAGEKITKADLTPRFNKTAVERAFIPAEGKIKKIEGVKEALKIRGVKRIFFHIKEGDYYKPAIDNVTKAGSVIAASPSLKTAQKAASAALKKIKFKYF